MGAATVTVLGATGKTGRAVALAALRRGLVVRGVSRHGPPSPRGDDRPAAGSDRATHDLPAGVDRFLADPLTGEGLVDALTGADAAYLVAPNVHPAEVDLVARAARVATEVGVARVVYHSVADPDDARMPHHVRKGRAERLLRGLRPDAVVLRPCAYQQNLLPAALAGRIEVAYRLDAPFRLVDLDDVAEVAASALADGLEPGSTHELAGPEKLTVVDLAETATRVLGRPVAASATTVEQWRAGPGSGLDPGAAEELAAMFRAYDESGFVADPGPLARLLDRPPTTWADLLGRYL
ncbi:SDR family oxidoreductase [Ornithinimicrobium sp. W1679]|uniref:SDR family oxidoreductase n=1 Tax=Ornithinimicrobium sp. W1679 TaxID=3418770 RepID=UPI003CECECB9